MEEDKTRGELSLVSHAKELELYLVGSWEPVKRCKQIYYMIRFVF